MARQLITDPHWAVKAQAGQADRIRPCIGRLQVCRSGNIGWVHNPSAGRELVWVRKQRAS